MTLFIYSRRINKQKQNKEAFSYCQYSIFSLWRHLLLLPPKTVCYKFLLSYVVRIVAFPARYVQYCLIFSQHNAAI